jgi:hypothetical protein
MKRAVVAGRCFVRRVQVRRPAVVSMMAIWASVTEEQEMRKAARSGKGRMGRLYTVGGRVFAGAERGRWIGGLVTPSQT